MKKEERVFVHEDKIQADKFNEAVAVLHPLLQAVVTEWNKMGISEMESNELMFAMEKPEKFYDRKISEKLPEPEEKEVGGFKVKKESIKDSLELPDPGKFYAASAKAYDKFCKTPATSSVFYIDGNIVTINEDAREEEIDACSRIYAVSREEKEAVELIKGFIEASEKLSAFATKHKLDQMFNINSGLRFDPWRYVILYPDGLKVRPSIISEVQREVNRKTNI